jgi:hypothetical protein
MIVFLDVLVVALAIAVVCSSSYSWRVYRRNLRLMRERDRAKRYGGQRL